MSSHPQLSADRFALKLGAFYAAYFLFGGIQLPFFPLWLESRGLDAQTIGIVIAVPMLVRIFVTPAAGHLADRFGALKATLVVASVGGTLAMAAVGASHGALAILVAYTVAACFFSPVLSMTDAYALNGLRARARAYGPVRLWGSAAFIAGNLLAGLLLQHVAAAHLIWLILAALAATCIAAILLEPLDPPPPQSREARPSPRLLWQSPVFLLVATAASLTQGSHALYYGFSALDWRAAGFGGPAIGALWGLGVLAEIALFAFAARLPPALGPLQMMAIGSAGGLLRWTAMAFDPPPIALPVLQVLHALSFAATHLGLIAFLSRTVPPGLSGTAQGTVATAAGIVMATATAASGALFAASGGVAYLAMAAMALAGFFCAAAAMRLREPPVPTDPTAS